MLLATLEDVSQGRFSRVDLEAIRDTILSMSDFETYPAYVQRLIDGLKAHGTYFPEYEVALDQLDLVRGEELFSVRDFFKNGNASTG